MKTFRRYFLLIMFVILTLVLTVGCGAKQSDPKDIDIKDKSHSATQETINIGTSEEMDFEETEKSPLEPEKVITTIYMDFETTEFERSSKNLQDAVKKYKGYVENSSLDYGQYRNNKRYKEAYYVIRIPKDLE